MGVQLFNIVAGDDFRSATKVRMDSVAAYMARSWASMEAHRKAEKRALDKAFPTRVKNTTSDEPVEAATVALVHYGGHLRAFAGDIPRMLNYSLALQIYTCFEEIGRKLCLEISARDQGLPVTIKDLKLRSDFEAIRLFLEKICRIEFQHWSTLEAFRKLRNNIVHEGGKVGDDKADQERFRRNISPIRPVHFSTEGRIIIPKSVIQNTFETIGSLWEAVFQQKKFGPVGTFLPDHGFDGGLIIEETKKGHKIKIVSTEDDW